MAETLFSDGRWRKLWRDLFVQHRARSIVVVVALATVLAAAGAVLNTAALLHVATVKGYRASQPAHATLGLPAGPALAPERAARALQQVQALPGVAAARWRRTAAVQVQASAPGHATVGGEGGWKQGWLLALPAVAAGGEPGTHIGRLRVEAGEWNAQAASGIAIESSSLAFAGAALGGTLQVSAGAATSHSLPVQAVLRDVSLAPGWMEHRVYGFVSPQTLAQLAGDAAADELQIRAADAKLSRADARRLAAAARALLLQEGLRVVRFDVPEPGRHIHAGQMNSLLMTQGAFALLALGVGVLLIVNLFSAWLLHDARAIGVMKVLGARPAQLLTLYAGGALLLGGVAAIAALPLAALAGWRYAAFKAELLNFPLAGHGIPLWAPALQLLVALALPVLAALLPVRRACRADTASSLRAAGAALNAAPLPRWLAPLAGRLPRLVHLALGQALRRRQRFVLTVLALAAGGAVLIAAASLREAVRASVDLLYASQRYQLTLVFTQVQPAAAVERTAREVAGVAGAEGWLARRAHRDGEGGAHDNLTLLGLPPQTRLLAPRLLAGRWLEPGDAQALVLARSLAREQPDLQPGQNLVLMIDGRATRWAIVGLVDSGPQPLAYVPRAALAGAGDGTSSSPDADSANRLVIAFDAALAQPGAGQLDAVLRLRSALTDAGVPVRTGNTLAENRRITEDHLVMVVDFLGVMGFVALAAGAITLAATMGSAVLERRREIGVLRVLGATSTRIVALLQAEALVIAGFAWCLALPLSVPIAAALGDAFSRVMFSVPLPWWPDARAAALWGLVMVGVALLACAAPAWRATRERLAPVLAVE